MWHVAGLARPARWTAVGSIVAEAPDVFYNPEWWESRIVSVRDKRGHVRWLHLNRFPSPPARARRIP